MTFPPAKKSSRNSFEICPFKIRHLPAPKKPGTGKSLLAIWRSQNDETRKFLADVLRGKKRKNAARPRKETIKTRNQDIAIMVLLLKEKSGVRTTAAKQLVDQGETQNPTATSIAAGLEHFILAVGIDTYDYPESRARYKRLP